MARVATSRGRRTIGPVDQQPRAAGTGRQTGASRCWRPPPRRARSSPATRISRRAGAGPCPGTTCGRRSPSGPDGGGRPGGGTRRPARLARLRCGRPSETGAAGRRWSSTSAARVRTSSPSRFTIATVTSSVRRSLKANSAASKRPSPFGEKLRRNVSCSITGVERFSRVVTKNAPTVANTSAANTSRRRRCSPTHPGRCRPARSRRRTRRSPRSRNRRGRSCRSRGGWRLHAPHVPRPSRYSTSERRLVDARGIADRAQLEAAGTHLLADLRRKAHAPWSRSAPQR